MKKIFLCMLLLLTLGLSCKDEPTKPTLTGTVKLSLDYAECKEIGLKLSFTDTDPPRGYTLLRDGEQITRGTHGNTEISLIDTTVLPGRDYIYIAQRRQDSAPEAHPPVAESTPLPVHTLDSTSHAIQWFVDTLGAQGVIRDVWVFDRNNAWAVGEMSIKDSSGKIKYPPYGAARWDGQKWTYLILSASNPAGYNSYLVPTGIFAFSETDIWLVSGGIHRFNGQQITQSYWVNYFEGNPNPILSFGQTVEKLWGTKNTNIYAVGREGGTVHFNGSTWSKMPSNTTVDLEDIYGIDENHIWATGTNGNYSSSVLLSYDGTLWKKYSEGTYYASSVWANTDRRLYLAGVSGFMIYDIQKEKYSGLIQTPNQYIMYCIGGTNVNDIFCTGANTEIIHFNCSTFYLYKDLQTKFSSDVYWLRIKVRSDIVIAGGGVWIGYNTAPVIALGYR